MIQEQFVSLETAKLLKACGFFETDDCIALYDCSDYDKFVIDSKIYEYGAEDYLDFMWGDEWRRFSYYLAPTLSVAMRWLREAHNLSIAPYRTACGYLYTIDRIPTGSTLFSAQFEGNDEDSGQFTTWELACDHAIKYCLEKLI